MPELSEMFADQAGKLKEHEEKSAQPVNVTYDTEEGYLAHLARVATLQPGQIVTWLDTEGSSRGVFFQFSKNGQPQVFFVIDGKAGLANLTPLCIVFEE
jgi:hypothetical protein